ncbi:MAG: L-rhamnose isomerase [Ruminococcaceae bacterium]|nr:L-rhamnose isomerase [Oscillospiraceae bacterium]
MSENIRYQTARERYASIGIDTEAAIHALSKVSISMHCWQGDDVRGFENAGALTGGIQATGNYPGAATTPEELMQDLDQAFSMIPGQHRVNVHAFYGIYENGKPVDRDAIRPEHFKAWVDYANARGLGLDFNPTFFSHPLAENGTLTNPDEKIREFWINHGIACIRISEYFAKETGKPCLMNIWIPDGMKDIPADRLGPRMRFLDSLDRILGCGYNKEQVLVTLESKVFGIGLESYTAGSAEFALSYATTRGIVPLMDNGHYHPTEVVSDKISSLLCFHPRIALHVTRGVRWDSDHVVRLDDETMEMMKEVVRCNALDRVILATDYFDASINRIAAWVIGMRSVQKALLSALLTPHAQLAALQNNGDFTELMMRQEELKLYPMGDVWEEFCARNGKIGNEGWFDAVKDYEKNVLAKRS